MAEDAPGAVGGAWLQDAEKWLNRRGAGRSRGVLAEPMALQPLEVAQRRRSQRQGVRKHPAPEGALRQISHRQPNQHQRARKHPAPEGALRRHPCDHLSQITASQKAPSTRSAYSRGLPCGGCRQRRKTASPTARPLNRPSEPTRITPPPWAPSSSTATKVSTPGGFVPGELARFQETSRSRNTSTAGTSQADAHRSGRHRETRQPPTSGQAVMRPCGRADSPAKPRPARRPRFRCGAGAGR